MAPLTAAEVVKHPEFPHVTWDLKPTRKGKIDVAHGRGGPFKLAYEVHGTGPNHLVWVMGLGAYKTGWQRQTKDFGHDQASKYSCLIFDNRGMAESDKPLMRYSTSEMAEDVFELVDFLGWTGKRELHVIGVSMGGMIAQEMAYAQPKRIASLSLVSTAARLVNTVGFFENLRNRINMFLPKDLDAQVADAEDRMFSREWLAAPDADGLFPTNADRFAAQEISKRMDTEGFTRKGFICQCLAAGWHHKDAAQLKRIADEVGRERILVLHGTADRMITVYHGDVLVDELGGEKSGIKYERFEGPGHVLLLERRREFRQLVAHIVDKTSALG